MGGQVFSITEDIMECSTSGLDPDAGTEALERRYEEVADCLRLIGDRMNRDLAVLKLRGMFSEPESKGQPVPDSCDCWCHASESKLQRCKCQCHFVSPKGTAFPRQQGKSRRKAETLRSYQLRHHSLHSGFPEQDTLMGDISSSLNMQEEYMDDEDIQKTKDSLQVNSSTVKMSSVLKLCFWVVCHLINNEPTQTCLRFGGVSLIKRAFWRSNMDNMFY